MDWDFGLIDENDESQKLRVGIRNNRKYDQKNP